MSDLFFCKYIIRITNKAFLIDSKIIYVQLFSKWLINPNLTFRLLQYLNVTQSLFSRQCGPDVSLTLTLCAAVLPDCNLSALHDGCCVVKEGSTTRINIPLIGTPIPTVTWKKGDTGIGDTGRMCVESSTGVTTLLIRDCQRGDAETYKIHARNNAGSKECKFTVKVVGKPGICTGPIKFDEITADGITLEWGPTTDDGGAEVSNYIVEKRRTTDNKWATVASAIQKTSMRVIRLHDGAEYIFRVFAENKYGVGECLRSEPVIAQHPFSECPLGYCASITHLLLRCP